MHRSFSQSNRELIHRELHTACGLIETFGGSYDLDIRIGYPPTVNDAGAVEVAMAAVGDLLGADQMLEATRVMAAEDFSFMAQQAPGCFLRLGVHNPTWDQRHMVHTPTFRMDETALTVGTASLVATALRWMEKH